MTPAKRIAQAQELELRVEKMLDLLSIHANASGLMNFPSELDEFLDDNCGVKDLDPGVLTLMDTFMPRDGEEPELDALLDLAPEDAAKILVLFATPARNYRHKDSWTSSWGLYYTHWVAAPTFDKAWARGVAWAKSRHAHNLSEAA